ncbi:MAG: winged helix DNA-binding domain-containing protein [Actinomycetota bacterium]|nr:winged helix DNA-binding domain-containing protein [Actinomycetota bacterium]
METVTISQLRRYVVAHQRFATRFRRGRAPDVEATVRGLSCVQLDSISTVERSHRLVLTSRIGLYPRGTVSALLAAGRIFEYWAHEACLVPMEDYGLYKWRMQRYRDAHPWRGNVVGRNPELAEQVLGEIRERGPLAARHFEGQGGGGMWNWKPAKEMLEALFSGGELAIAGRSGFQRLYDLPERVIPKPHLDAPVPSEAEFRRGLTLRAVRARGALSERGIAEHCRFRGGAREVRPHADGLVAEGLLRRVAVDDGGSPVLVPADAVVDGDPAPGGVLLSPFENLLWDRPFVERLFGFRHVIEVYKREHERVYGYYVLPFLVGDRLVGRADLKTERKEGVLRVRAFHLQPGVRARRAVEDAFERTLSRLARVLELERVER